MPEKLSSIIETLARQAGYKAGVTAAKAALDPSPYASLNIKDRARLETFISPTVLGETPQGMSEKKLRVLTEVEAQLSRATPDERKVILKALRKDYAHQSRLIAKEVATKKHRCDTIKRTLAALTDIETKLGTELRLEKPPAPSFPELRRATSRGEVMYADKAALENADGLNLRWEKEVFRHVNHFVVEHDWASAFARADLGTFKLPYCVCAFDFQVNGLPVVGFAFQDEGQDDIDVSMAVRSSLGWVLPAMKGTLLNDELLSITEGGLVQLLIFVAKQVRAVSIALDAEIAVTAMTRAPYTGKGHGDRKPLPPISYNVVSLARRQRAAPRLDSQPSSRHVRLHFRRGHWRHYEDVKTWIKWTLVGDPDLGFVDKHYRL